MTWRPEVALLWQAYLRGHLTHREYMRMMRLRVVQARLGLLQHR